MSILTIQQITNEALRLLEKAHIDYHKPTYYIRPSYGKYTVFKREHIDNAWVTTPLARVDKTTAEGMMKLLKGANDE